MISLTLVIGGTVISRIRDIIVVTLVAGWLRVTLTKEVLVRVRVMPYKGELTLALILRIRGFREMLVTGIIIKTKDMAETRLQIRIGVIQGFRTRLIRRTRIRTGIIQMQVRIKPPIWVAHNNKARINGDRMGRLLGVIRFRAEVRS